MILKDYNAFLKYLAEVVLVLWLTFFFYFLVSFVWNKKQIQPSYTEKKILESYLKKSKKITTDKDFIKIQNYVIKDIKSGANDRLPLDIINIIKYKKGLCYHRSLLLQKILLMNNIDVRPIFLYVRKDGKMTTMLDFFSKSIYTHNTFEFRWKGKWYLMLTNQIMFELKSIEDYAEIDSMPKGFQYFRHINNRNGVFIFPSYLIDIY